MVVAEHGSLLKADRVVWFAGLTAAVVLTVSRYHATTGEYRRAIGPMLFAPGRKLEGLLELLGLAPIAEHLYWFWGSAFLFFVLPMIAASLVPGVKTRELGAGLGDWRYGLKATAFLYFFMLPLVVAASFTPAFAGQYPMARAAATSVWALASYEVSYGVYFVGWEFVYRGLLCVALYPRLGASALVLQAIPFAVMHGGKPELEAYGSILAALALGVVAVRARSFWYGALLHTLVAVTMDLLALAQTGRLPKL